MTGASRWIAPGGAVLAAATLAALCAAGHGRAHDFRETRRLVLSLAEQRVELLIAYELRPSPLAESLRAQFDADHDGVAGTPWERLARSRVVLPRFHRGLRLTVDGQRLSLRLERLDFEPGPVERGRGGICAVALFGARLPGSGAAARRIRVIAGEPSGLVVVEAQADEGMVLSSDSLPSRPDDPVLGPVVLAPRAVLELVLAPSGP